MRKRKKMRFYILLIFYLFSDGPSEDKKMICKRQPIQKAESTTVNVTRIK